MFNTSEQNIPQIKAAIKTYNKVWFHGCGNLYDNQEASDFRQKFTNPSNEASVYRVVFDDVRLVPKTKKELDELLLKSRSQEIVTEKMPKVSQGIKTLKVEEEIDEDAQLQQMIDEENAAKGK